MKNWEELGGTEDVDTMAEIITNLVSESLDERAPVKTFKIRNQNKHGISDKTRSLIKERDNARKAINKSTDMDKKVLHVKYKKLRNKVNNELKKDTRDHNNNKVDKAKDENEIWKIVNDIYKPKTSEGITLLENDVKIVKEEEVAEIFNEFFINKLIY